MVNSSIVDWGPHHNADNIGTWGKSVLINEVCWLQGCNCITVGQTKVSNPGDYDPDPHPDWLRLHGGKLDSNQDSDHLSHVDCDPDSGPGARVNAAIGVLTIQCFLIIQGVLIIQCVLTTQGVLTIQGVLIIQCVLIIQDVLITLRSEQTIFPPLKGQRSEKSTTDFSPRQGSHPNPVSQLTPSLN